MSPVLVALLVGAVAALPWLAIVLLFSRALPLLSTLLAHLQANRVVGGEPATIVDRRLAIQEEDQKLKRDIELRAFNLQELQVMEDMRREKPEARDNFAPPTFPRIVPIEPNGPIPPESFEG